MIEHELEKPHPNHKPRETCYGCGSALTEPEDGPVYCAPCCDANAQRKAFNSTGEIPEDEHFFGPY